MKVSRIFFLNLLILGLCLCSLSLFVGGASLADSLPDNTLVRGFPAYFIQHQEGSFFEGFLFKVPRFLITLTFWCLVCLSSWQIFRRDKKNWIFSFILAGVFMLIDSSSTSSCGVGYPLIFKSICGQPLPFSSLIMWVHIIIDYLYWMTFAVVIVNFFRWVRIGIFGYWKYIVTPLFIACISFFSYQSCDGMICFEGYGLPIPYYNNHEFQLVGFLLDLLFWAAVFLLVSGVIFLVKKILSKKETKQS